jgi:hypothetical protein
VTARIDLVVRVPLYKRCGYFRERYGDLHTYALFWVRWIGTHNDNNKNLY